ncbi:MAG: RluA family pseudouridine synthase [Saprospiraceae bacterium]|nr:RluA family pseudouridine synthase [Candidatus Opimibacter skivensis]
MKVVFCAPAMNDLEIIYEDNHLIAINKPNGLLVHTDDTGDTSLEQMLKEYLKEKYKKPGNVFLQSCHRLDRPVSGALIFAKTSKGKERMSALFAARKVDKTYLALVSRFPDPDEGDLETWILKDRVKNTVEVVKGEKSGAVKARTLYKTLGKVGNFFLVRLHPLTGKSHQLRVHMKFLGCPIAGDVKYGGPSIDDPSSILLHCRKMEFIHPIQKVPVVLIADIPRQTLWNKGRRDITALEASE